MDLMKSSGRPRGRSIALLLAGLLAGTVLIQPAVGHVTRRLGHLTKKHLDKRYYNEGQKVGDANTLDGLNSTAFLGANAKASDADRLDGLDSTVFSQRLWAYIDGSNGSLLRGQGVTATFRCIPGCDGGPGAYEIVFNRDITTCGYLATLANTTAGRGHEAPNGQIGVRPLSTSGQGVSVTTFNAAGARADQSFVVSVFC